MARPLPVNLLFAGSGAVLIISALSNRTVGETLKEPFKGFKPAASQTSGITYEPEGGGTMSPVLEGSSGTAAPSPATFAGAPFSPSPTSLDHRRPLTPHQEGIRGVAEILIKEGIVNPTNKQINEAIAKWNREKAYRLAGENAPTLSPYV